MIRCSRASAVLANVGGVAAIVPGGSRARGTAHDASDYDIGQVHQFNRTRVVGYAFG
jgi:predicted nucleotidyltransferase